MKRGWVLSSGLMDRARGAARKWSMRKPTVRLCAPRGRAPRAGSRDAARLGPATSLRARLGRGLGAAALSLAALAGCSDDGPAAPVLDFAVPVDARVPETPADLSTPEDLGAPPDMSGVPVGGTLYAQSFDQSGSGWPAPWRVLGGVDVADVVGGRARLIPVVSDYSLARMGLAASEANTDVLFTVEWKDFARQGVGFYVRQNGGYLTKTTPNGQGYAVFVEGFNGVYIGVWRELYGAEQMLTRRQNPYTGTISTGVPYKVRFRCLQETPTATRLQARIWLASQVEPTAWDIDTTDGTVALQNTSGGYAVDAWSSITPTTPGAPKTADLFVDDIVITRAK